MVIKLYIPNNRKDDTNDKEEKSCYKNTVVVLLSGFAELSLPIVGVSLVLGSSHGNKGEHHISDYKSDTDERAFTADKQHTRHQRHQYTGDEERVGQDLNIYCNAIGEKAF